MKNMEARRTGTKPKARRLSRRSAATSMHRGHKVTPNQNPPNVSLMPWNHIVIVHTGSEVDKTHEFSTDDLKHMLRKQIDPNGYLESIKDKIVFDFRFMNVRVWNMTGKVIALTVFDPTTQKVFERNQPQLCGLVDIAGKDTYACAGYEFSDAHKEVVVRSDDQRHVFTIVTSGANDVMLFYLTMRWKITGPAKGPGFSGDVLSQILTTTRAVKTISERIRDNTKIIADAQPGLVSKTINGITKIGAYVAPLAGDDDVKYIVRLLEEMGRGLIRDGDTIQVCEICKQAFDNAFEMSIHMSREHSANSYTCQICDEKFLEESKHAAHLQLHRAFICQICDQACLDIKTYSEHCATHVSD